jgi:4'-phosphopantetheinyl transferase
VLILFTPIFGIFLRKISAGEGQVPIKHIIGKQVMPFVKIENINEDCCWGLWKIDESPEVLHKACVLSSEEKSELKKISNPVRKTEWLAARALLKVIIEGQGLEYSGISKNESDKPYLVNNGIHISLAHSFPVAGAIVNRKKPCGIDIEKPKPALFQIASKFLSETEMGYIKNNSMDLCVAWACKEVMFKMYGRKKISFKKNLQVDPFIFNWNGWVQGLISFENEPVPVQFEYQLFEDSIICYSL